MSFVAVAIVGSAAIGAGASMYNSRKARKAGAPGEMAHQELPEHPESKQARQDISAKLKEFETQPGYGAISPDWGDIWNRAKGKISRYYWGEPGSTGLAGKVKASAARRGVSDSPAMETMLTQMGQQESLDLNDANIEQTLQEALMGETGRRNWMEDMFRLSGITPAYQTSTGVAKGFGPSTGEMMGELGSAIGKAGQQYGQNRWMERMMNYDKYGGYGGAPGGRSSMASYLGATGANQTPVPPSYYQ